MATYNFTVKSADGDYASLVAAEAGIRASGVYNVNGNVINIVCYGMTDTNAVAFAAGWNAVLINILADATAQNEGVWDSGGTKYLLQAANSHVLGLTSSTITTFTVTGLQIEVSGQNANYQSALQIAGGASGATILIDKCILKGSNNATYRSRVLTLNTRVVKVRNTIVWNANTSINSVANTALHCDGQNHVIYDCTFSGGYNSAYITSGAPVAKNCIFRGAGNIVGTGWGATSDYNTSDKEVTTGGEHDEESQTFTFTNAAAGDFTLGSSDTGAIDNGVDLSGDAALAVTDDIRGQSRVGLTYDCGAYEYVAPAPSSQGNFFELFM